MIKYHKIYQDPCLHLQYMNFSKDLLKLWYKVFFLTFPFLWLHFSWFYNYLGGSLKSVNSMFSLYLCSSNGTSDTKLVISQEYFRILSWINTAPIFIALRIDIPIQMELSFTSKRCKFWVKNTIMDYLQKPVTRLCSFLIITFFSCLNLSIYGNRQNFLVTLLTFIIETCGCWANCVRDLQGEYSNLGPNLLGFPHLAQHYV